MALRYSMKRAGAGLIALLFFLRAAAVIGQGDDPSEIFLKAYLSAQQGEKLERENRSKTALAKYRFAGSLIETLRRSHSDWQPAIVEYRGRKISEGILRIQERTTRQNALSAGSSPLPEVAPVLPESETWSEPGPEVVYPQLDQAATQTSRDAAIKETTKKLRDKIDQLQTALGKARNELETARKEKETVNTSLNETNSKLKRAEDDLEKARKSEHQTRDELVKAQESLRASQASQQSGISEQQQLRSEVTHLKDALSAADESRLTAEKQRDDAQAKFADIHKQIAALEHQRDEALAQLKVAKETEQGVQLLLAEKDALQQKLANAEETVRTLSESDPTNAEKFAEMNQQVAELQQQLSEAQKRNDYLIARAAELDVQLDDASTQLQVAKLAGANSEESVQLARENELLRNIVVRERQEEARRDETRNLVLAELGRLKIRSETLNRQIEFLAQPVTKLSSQELALLRQPVISVSDQRAGLFKASFVFEKKAGLNSISTAKAIANARSGGESDGKINRPDPSKTDVPPKIQALVRAARKNVQQGNYRAAEKQYQQILGEDPNNLDAFSNLGVVYVRSGNLRSAESTLKKAVAIAPDNDFLLTTLGIVQYRQSKFDDAIAELTKAVAINPNSATAHNYLGIAASQKGRQKEAEKEILQAIANNPDDADAHFNLAVILITTQPSSKELAREHYARATALGIQPSASLEKLLQ
jgi:Flp pilus assembly protein TadD/predicted  nucleic acid-binding Zn-ribbon protein